MGEVSVKGKNSSPIKQMYPRNDRDSYNMDRSMNRSMNQSMNRSMNRSAVDTVRQEIQREKTGRDSKMDYNQNRSQTDEISFEAVTSRGKFNQCR